MRAHPCDRVTWPGVNEAYRDVRVSRFTLLCCAHIGSFLLRSNTARLPLLLDRFITRSSWAKRYCWDFLGSKHGGVGVVAPAEHRSRSCAHSGLDRQALRSDCACSTKMPGLLHVVEVLEKLLLYWVVAFI